MYFVEDLKLRTAASATAIRFQFLHGALAPHSGDFVAMRHMMECGSVAQPRFGCIPAHDPFLGKVVVMALDSFFANFLFCLPLHSPSPFSFISLFATPPRLFFFLQFCPLVFAFGLATLFSKNCLPKNPSRFTNLLSMLTFRCHLIRNKAVVDYFAHFFVLLFLTVSL